MNLSAHSAARRDCISRQSGELPSQSFTVPSYMDHPGTVVRVPAQYALFECIRHQRYRQALLLVEAGVVQLDSRNEVDCTPLMCVCTSVEAPKLRARFMQLFLGAGADPNLQDKNGMTALMHAVVLDQKEVTLMLAEHPKVDLNVEDQKGNIALQHACRLGRIQLAAILLNAYRRKESSWTTALEHRNTENMNAYDLAVANDHSEVSGLLNTAFRNPVESARVDVPQCSYDVEDGTQDYSIDAEGTNVAMHGDHAMLRNQDLPDITVDEESGFNERKISIAKGKKSNSHTGILPLLSLSDVDTEFLDLSTVSLRRSRQCKRDMNTGSKSLNETYKSDSDRKYTLKQSRSHLVLSDSSRGTLTDSTVHRNVKNHGQMNRESLHLPPIKGKLIEYEAVVRLLNDKKK